MDGKKTDKLKPFFFHKDYGGYVLLEDFRNSVISVLGRWSAIGPYRKEKEKCYQNVCRSKSQNSDSGKKRADLI